MNNRRRMWQMEWDRAPLDQYHVTFEAKCFERLEAQPKETEKRHSDLKANYTSLLMVNLGILTILWTTTWY